MPSVFPNGIEAVVKKTGLPIEAHNRWWYVRVLIRGLTDFRIVSLHVCDIAYADSACHDYLCVLDSHSQVLSLCYTYRSPQTDYAKQVFFAHTQSCIHVHTQYMYMYILS